MLTTSLIATLLLFLADGSKVDWMKLFLNRTHEQSNRIENSLHDADIVLQEVLELLYSLFLSLIFSVSIYQKSWFILLKASAYCSPAG